jgi:hypothetical protein
MDIKDYFVASESRQAGVIHGLDGHVVVIHKASGRAYYGMEGDPVYENDTLVTLVDSRCRLRFLSEDVVTMASDAHFTVESSYDQKDEGRKGSVFSLMKGKAMFYALRLFKYRESRMTVNTPTAVVGVRGTKFGAEVYWLDEKRTSGPGVRVADLGREIGPYLAQVGPGPGPGPGPGRIMTDCFSEDGYLDVNGKTVGPGEMFRGELGRVIPTPPQYAANFQAQTEVRKDDRKSGGAGGAEGGKASRAIPQVGTLAGMPLLSPVPPPPEKNLDQISQEQGNKTITDQTQGTNMLKDKVLAQDGKVAGEGSFIAAMITDGDKDGLAFVLGGRNPMYFSSLVNPLNDSSGLESHTAYENAHPENSDFKMVVQETGGSMEAQVNYFTMDHPVSTSLALHTFTYSKIGSYTDAKGSEYLSWGVWSDSTAPVGKIREDDASPGGAYFAAKGMIWHVEGDLTHPDYLDLLRKQNAVFSYSGSAVGVYAQSATSAEVQILGGTFSCQVNFGSRQVSNFNIDTSASGSYRVNLQGGSGSINEKGSFSISGSTFGADSSINGQPIAAGSTGANGAIFGAKAEGTAGTWYARGSGSPGADYWATGEFHGRR